MRILPHDAVALGIDTECRNDADVSVDAQAGAGAGAGEASAEDTPDVHDEAVDDDARAADVAGGDEDDDDLEGEDERLSAEELGELRDDPRVKKILNQRRNALRKAAKAKALRNAAQVLGVTPDNLAEIVHRARTFETQQRDPRLRHEGESRAADTPAADWKPPAFDRTKAPYDPKDQGANWMLDQLESAHNNHWALFEVMRGMAQELRSITQTHRTSQRQAMTQQWTSAAEAAKKKLPPAQHDLFIDLMGAAYRDGKAMGKRFDPAKVAEHYLKKLLPQRPKVPAVAAKQRIATNVQRLPTRSAYAGGAPAPAGDRSKERISDIARRTTNGVVIG